MAFLGSFDICASGLSAQRLRMDIAAENIANIDTTRTQGGGSYQRKDVVFESFGGNSFREALRNASHGRGYASAARGVRVAGIIQDDREMKRVYNPDHPDADEDGYVLRSNVNRMEEQFDLMSASNAYYANLTALEVVKAMTMKTLEIGK